MLLPELVSSLQCLWHAIKTLTRGNKLLSKAAAMQPRTHNNTCIQLNLPDIEHASKWPASEALWRPALFCVVSNMQ